MLDLVVVDLAGPNRPQTLGRKLYDMVIVDTFSQRFFVVLLANKSDAAAELMRWIPRVEVQTGQKLHRLRSDNWGRISCSRFHRVATTPRSNSANHSQLQPPEQRDHREGESNTPR